MARQAGAPGGMLSARGSDFRDRKINIRREVGMWLYKNDSLKKFQAFCVANNVKARGYVKITTTEQYARCLRLLKPVNPGAAIVTAPIGATYNFLGAAKEMYEVNNGFNMRIEWRNWNQRLPYLHNAAVNEFVMAGWMVRCTTRDHGKFQDYFRWLFEDTSGRDGLGSGINQERGDDGNPALDTAIGQMANDSGEEFDEFLEYFFRAYACIMKRALPVETKVIKEFLPGTNLEKLDINELFAPTLIPLVDCVPQEEVGYHNVMLDYHSADDLQGNPRLWQELEITPAEVRPEVIGAGMFSLRAMEQMDPGSILVIRGWPKTEEVDNESIKNQIMEQTRMMNNAQV